MMQNQIQDDHMKIILNMLLFRYNWQYRNIVAWNVKNDYTQNLKFLTYNGQYRDNVKLNM